MTGISEPISAGRELGVWNGAVEILAAVKNVAPEHRLAAVALALDAFIKETS